MTEDDSFNRKRYFSHYEPITNKGEAQFADIEQIRKKSFCGSKVTLKPVETHPPASPMKDKRNLNSKKYRGLWSPRKPKKCYSTKYQPSTPHNTTQYIVDALNIPSGSYNKDLGNDRLEFDFQHHAMAGSMMDLMERKLLLNGQEAQKGQDKAFLNVLQPLVNGGGSDVNSEEFGYLKARQVKSTNSMMDDEDFPIDLMIENYKQLFNKSENNNAPLQEVVKDLVAAIKKKDDQIGLLKSVVHNFK